MNNISEKKNEPMVKSVLLWDSRTKRFTTKDEENIECFRIK